MVDAAHAGKVGGDLVDAAAVMGVDVRSDAARAVKGSLGRWEIGIGCS